MGDIMGIGPPPSTLRHSEDGMCISGSSRSLSIGSVGSGSEAESASPDSILAKAKASGIKKIILKKGKSLNIFKKGKDPAKSKSKQKADESVNVDAKAV